MSTTRGKKNEIFIITFFSKNKTRLAQYLHLPPPTIRSNNSVRYFHPAAHGLNRIARTALYIIQKSDFVYASAPELYNSIYRGQNVFAESFSLRVAGENELCDSRHSRLNRVFVRDAEHYCFEYDLSR